MDIDQVRAQLPGTAPALLRYARLLTGDEHDAADLVQDTLLRGLQAAAGFDGRSSLTTWLRRLLHNAWVDTVRATREDPSDEIADLVEARWQSDDYTVDAAVVVERAATRDDLREALTHLPTIYRSAVVLHDAEGLTVAEIAEITGVGLPAAKQRLRRGRMMLVTALAESRTAPQRGVPMRCWEARSQVSDYLDGALAPGAHTPSKPTWPVAPPAPRCTPPWSPPETSWPATPPRRTPTPSSHRSSPTGSPSCWATGDHVVATAPGHHLLDERGQRGQRPGPARAGPRSSGDGDGFAFVEVAGPEVAEE